MRFGEKFSRTQFTLPVILGFVYENVHGVSCLSW